MYTPDVDRIIELVCVYSHLSPEHSPQVVELSQSAALQLDAMLERPPETTAEISLCEQAAACIAVYGLACLEAAQLEPVLTQSGSFSVSGKGGQALEAALRMKEESLSSISHMLSGDFYFEGVEC